MARAFSIVAIVFGIALIILTGFYAEEVRSARWNSWDSFSFESYGGYSDSNDDDNLTQQMGFISAAFFAFFIFTYILYLVKVKTKTTKVLSIIGLSITGIMLLWDLVMIASPGSVSFDETAPGWVFYCFIAIAFAIVGTVHSFRKKA